MRKVCITCLLWGVTSGFPSQRASTVESISMWWWPCSPVWRRCWALPCSTVSNINSLWPRDAIWRQKSGSGLDQVMACCLTAPSHYMNQCWFITSKVQWCSSEGTFTWDITTISTKISLKIIFLRFYWNLPGTNELSFYVSLLYI